MKTSEARNALGKYGEDLAARRLTETGMTVLARNWRGGRTGEIDIVARDGDALVSVTHFPLRRPYDQSQFDTAARALDAVAARLAKAAGHAVERAETVTVANRKARSYAYGTRRIGFVLAGRDEFQLFCTQQQSAACDLLFNTFTLTGPQA